MNFALPPVWVYKNNARVDEGGDWADFFEVDGPQIWGGTWVTNKPDNKRMVTEEMAPGDMIIAWQSDTRSCPGLASIVRIDRKPDGQAELVLQVEVVYDPPQRLLANKRSDPDLVAVSAFKQGHAGTFYRTTPQEAIVLCTRLGLLTDDDD